jgi:hypothetical protein
MTPTDIATEAVLKDVLTDIHFALKNLGGSVPNIVSNTLLCRERLLDAQGKIGRLHASLKNEREAYEKAHA